MLDLVKLECLWDDSQIQNILLYSISTIQKIIIHKINFFQNLPQSMFYQMQLWHKLDPLCPKINQLLFIKQILTE